MKSIQKLSVAVAVGVIFSTGLLQAQKGHRGATYERLNPEERQEMMVDRLAYELVLSEEQKEKVKEIYGKHFEELKKLREEEKKVFEEMRKKRDEMRGQVTEEVKKELSKEQQIKYDDLVDRFEARKQDFKRGREKPRW